MAGESEGYQPAVVTLRPDNFLTIGLLFGGTYLAAVLSVQLAFRAGWLKPAAAPAAASGAAGPVV